MRCETTKVGLSVFGVLSLLCTITFSEEPPAPLAPPDPHDAVRRGVAFLVGNQNADGSWGTPHNTKNLNIFAPVPGSHHAFQSAVTALCVQALIETNSAQGNPRALQAIERGEAWLLERLPKLRRADPVALYNVWGHAYGIQALTAMHRRAQGNPKRQRQIVKCIQTQIALLRRYESVDGGWGYYDFRAGAQRPSSSSLSFVSATVLTAFHDARSLGVKIPTDLVQRARDSIERQQKEDNSYLYGEYLKWRPMAGINRPAGSLGRSQACNLALRLWDDEKITDDVLAAWLDRLIERNDWLSFGRKRPVPHESWFQVAGYFYYYGHYYAARCAASLPADRAAPYQKNLATILTSLQEKEGCWWDFPLYDYHRQYGTALALMSLAHCGIHHESKITSH